MEDVQSTPAEVPMDIDRVGVKNLRLPLVVRDKARGRQHTVAEVDLGADLPAAFKGTHMSRLVEALGAWKETLDYQSLKALLADMRERLSAQRAYVIFRFPYFMEKLAPSTQSPGLMSYECQLVGELGGDDERPSFLLEVDVPVMTVCPCSLAICEKVAAHSQRAIVRIACRFHGFVWLEDLVEIAESAASAPVHSLLKREDEKAVTERAFANPTFVEDVVRNAAHALESHARIRWFRVEVESLESIHDHNAYASIEKVVRP
ncbi:MAG: GTP cyclohydrolase FolE2 [Oceanidesulfovibrio sp.]